MIWYTYIKYAKEIIIIIYTFDVLINVLFVLCKNCVHVIVKYNSF